jgi:hypothetical protein
MISRGWGIELQPLVVIPRSSNVKLLNKGYEAMKDVCVVATILLTGLFSFAAMAKEVDLRACTKVGNMAVPIVDVEGSICR